MSSREQLGQKILSVLSADTSNFIELVRIAGLDPSKHFCNTDLRDVDFSECDLKGFNLTGSDISGCNFKGALLAEAILSTEQLAGPEVTAAADFEKIYTQSKIKASRTFYEVPSRPCVFREHSSNLDILFIPFPFEIDADCFVSSSKLGGLDRSGWSTFEIYQNWLEDSPIVAIVDDLLRQCSLQGRHVDGVVFPEYALNYRFFEEISRVVFERNSSAKFLVSGSSSDPSGSEGSFALVRYLDQHQSKRQFKTSSARKHHRWRLDAAQIANYGLEGELESKTSWWEKISLGERKLNFFDYDRKSAFGALICEDLARNEATHEQIRAVAPELIFALLMDGPQLRNRWPARYAEMLCQSSGPSVITFSSMGLLKRANQRRGDRNNQVLAVHNSDSSAFEISLSDGAHGVLLTLENSDRGPRSDGKVAANWKVSQQIEFTADIG